MSTWTPAIPKLTVTLKTDGVSCETVPDVTVDYNLGMNADADVGWPVVASRLRDSPTDTKLLTHPQGLWTFRNPPPAQPSKTKKRGQLTFAIDRYNSLIEQRDAGALNLAGAWNGGRLELEVVVKQGDGSQLLQIDLAV